MARPPPSVLAGSRESPGILSASGERALDSFQLRTLKETLRLAQRENRDLGNALREALDEWSRHDLEDDEQERIDTIRRRFGV